jgi:hypothetical protein
MSRFHLMIKLHGLKIIKTCSIVKALLACCAQPPPPPPTLRTISPAYGYVYLPLAGDQETGFQLVTKKPVSGDTVC